MNALGMALVWCVAQVTLIGVLCGGLYFSVRRLRPAAAAPVAMTGLAVVVLLSALALSPWPRWTLPTAGRPSAADAADAALASPSAAGEVEDTRPRTGEQPPPLAESDERSEPAGAGPSAPALLWQALVDELSRPQASAPDAGWQWPAVAAVLLLAGATTGVTWLLGGLLAVRSYRRRSRAVEDAALWELADVVRAELGCRRPIEIRQSDDLVTAATIGWRRPVVLLPPDWTAWTDQQRRAVLAHEIAHVSRNDFLAAVCGQLGPALHFYHPLVHWLLGRLRLEQELAADAAAAKVSGGQREYLAAIAELAIAQQDRALVWPARSFLPTRNAFLRRIVMLRDSKLRFDRLSPAARWLAVGAVLLCGLLVAGLRGPDVGPRGFAAEAAAASAAADSALAGDKSPAATIDLTGVPADAKAICVIRPAAIFRHREVDEFRKMLNEPGGPGEEFTLPVEEIEQLTYVLLPAPDAETGSQPGVFGRPVAIIRATRPYSFDTFIRKEVPEATSKEYRGRSYYAPGTSKKARDAVDGASLVPARPSKPTPSANLPTKGAGRSLADLIPKGMRVYVLQVPHGTGIVGGFVLPGDKVDVVLTLREGGANDRTARVTTNTLLEGVQVLHIEPGLGPRDRRGTYHEDDGFVLIVTPEQVKQLKDAEDRGELYVRVRGSQEKPNAYARAVARSGEVVFPLDERTIAVGAEPDVQHVIRYLGGPPPEILGPKESWKQWEADAIVLAVDPAMLGALASAGPARTPAGVRVATPNEAFGQFAATVGAPVAPIWEKTTVLMAGVRLDGQLRVHGVAIGKDAEGAARVKETVEALRVLARNALDQLQARVRAGDRGPPPEAGVFLTVAEKLLGNVSIRQEGNTVLLQTSVAMKDLDLEPIVKGAKDARDGQIVRAVRNAREASSRVRSTNNLKQIALGMHNYHDLYKHLPSATLYGPDGKTPYSWRVALLPLVEQNDLYKQYRFDEPWDGPNNRKLLEKIPPLYRSPSAPAGTTNAAYFVVVGPGTVFEAMPRTRGPIDFSDIRDGTSNTLMLVEAKRDIPWTKPEDIPYDPQKPIPALGGWFEAGFHAAMCDGSVQFFRKEIPRETLRSLIERSDGRVINRDGGIER